MTAKKKKITPWVYLALLILLTSVIFSFSAESAEKSSEKSDSIVGIVQKICDALGIDAEIVDKPIRKTAHFMEFALLGVLSYLCAREFHLGISSALLYSLLVAVTDETIQMYSPERYSSTGDVLLDFSGALFGALMMLIILRSRKKNK